MGLDDECVFYVVVDWFSNLVVFVKCYCLKIDKVCVWYGLWKLRKCRIGVRVGFVNCCIFLF